ncbi:MAG: hypothetical protein R2713_22000 [Ilumatobacteraceae bacterium]
MPLIAASTCTHMPCSCAIGAISGVGSNASELVVPRLQHTQNGVSPAATSAATSSANASGRIANCSSWGTIRS